MYTSSTFSSSLSYHSLDIYFSALGLDHSQCHTFPPLPNIHLCIVLLVLPLTRNTTSSHLYPTYTSASSSSLSYRSLDIYFSPWASITRNTTRSHLYPTYTFSASSSSLSYHPLNIYFSPLDLDHSQYHTLGGRHGPGIEQSGRVTTRGCMPSSYTIV